MCFARVVPLFRYLRLFVFHFFMGTTIYWLLFKTMFPIFFNPRRLCMALSPVTFTFTQTNSSHINTHIFPFLCLSFSIDGTHTPFLSISIVGTALYCCTVTLCFSVRSCVYCVWHWMDTHGRCAQGHSIHSSQWERQRQKMTHMLQSTRARLEKIRFYMKFVA